MSKIKINNSRIVTAFTDQAIGTKVLNAGDFLSLLEEGIRTHDPSNDQEEGQHFVLLPPSAIGLVSSGVGIRTLDPNDFVKRLYRGRVDLFLSREHAAQVTGVAVIVHTIDAYTKDPQVDEEEAKRLIEMGTTHVLVAPLSFAGPGAPLSAYRFCSNIDGGNNAYTLDSLRVRPDVLKQVQALLPGPDKDLEEIKAALKGEGDILSLSEVDVHLAVLNSLMDEAKEIAEFERDWCVVAD